MSNAGESPINFDDLLSGSHAEVVDPVESTQTEAVVEATPLSADSDKENLLAEIEELKAALAAKKDGDDDPVIYTTEVGTQEGDEVTIHFREEGFSAWGQIWHRGQEVTLREGSQDWERTRDRTGFTWLDLRDDEAAQEARYGKRYFASGPFVPRRGEKFEDPLVVEDQRRGGRVPRATA